MELSHIKWTNRVDRLLKYAIEESLSSNYKVLTPMHLLIGCLREKTGVLGEIYLRSGLTVSTLREMANLSYQTGHSCSFLNTKVTPDVLEVFKVAIQYMKRYNQVMLNEGHLLKALILTGVLNNSLGEEDKDLIINLGTTSRDMITHLGHYKFPTVQTSLISKASKKTDKDSLVHFVETQFSKEWAKSIYYGLSSEVPTIYIARNHLNDLVGFAGYDIYQDKKGYFGPMGVSLTNRIKGIGYSLLHHCLRDMHDIGYEYAIIGGAGPLEFYERACNAVVIPKMEPIKS